jgi:hypothetical protein
MAEEFLHRPNVLPGLQQMGRKTMAQRVGSNTSRDSGLGCGPFDCALNPNLMQMMPSPSAATWIHGELVSGKNKLPFPLEGGVGILPGQSAWQFDLMHALLTILFELLPPSIQMLVQFGFERRRKGHPSILIAFSSPYRDLVAIECQILHTEPQRFRDPHPSTIQQPCNYAFCTIYAGQQGLYLLAAEYDRKSLWTACAGKIAKVSYLLFHYLAVKKHYGIERLVLGAGCYPLVYRQVTEELVDFSPAHTRGALAVVI